jgi:hypothetical protein
MIVILDLEFHVFMIIDMRGTETCKLGFVNMRIVYFGAYFGHLVFIALIL